MDCNVSLLYCLLVPFFLTVAGCNGQETGQNNTPPPALAASYNGIQFERIHFEEAMPSCTGQNKNAPCARMTADFPRAVSGPQRLQQFINDTISYYVRESLSAFATPREELLPSMDSIARHFIRDYENFVKQNDDYGFTWEVETKGEILFQNDKVLSVSLDNYSFTGGAHPNSFRYLLNFDLKNREMLHLEDIIADEARFKARVEEAFRQYHQLQQGADLNEAGFFWDQAFFLPANFAIKQNGLYLHYNNYEAAPYAAGSTDLLLPWEKLQGVIERERLF